MLCPLYMIMVGRLHLKVKGQIANAHIYTKSSL